MLVKAVAHHTTASFIRVVGSEFVQKYLGEGPRMVRDVFRLARENAPQRAAERESDHERGESREGRQKRARLHEERTPPIRGPQSAHV